MLRKAVIVATSLACTFNASAGELGPTYSITSALQGTQDFVGCSRAQNGDSLTLWRSGDTAHIPYLKRTDAAGAQIGGVENLRLPNDTIAVSANNVGGFVTLSTKKNGAYFDVYASIYNRAGALTLAPFRVNDGTQIQNVIGTVKVAKDGSFVVAWQTWANLEPQKLYMKRFTANGAAMTEEKLLTSGDNLALLGLDTDPSGNVVVGYWSAENNRINTWSVRYSTTSNWLYAPERVNIYQGVAQPGGTLSMNTSGNYVITWSVYGQDGNGFSTYAQLYLADGSRYGMPIKVSTALSTNETGPTVALFDNNSYAVGWRENINYINTFKLRQVYAGGGAMKDEVTVSPALPYINPWAICADTSGNIAVKWRDYQTNSSGWRADMYSHDYIADTVQATTILANNQQISNLSDVTGGWKYFKVNVPANSSNMQITLSSQTQPASGNADLYLRYGAMPSATAWDARTTLAGNDEGMSINNPPPGSFYIAVYGQAAYAAAALRVSFR